MSSVRVGPQGRLLHMLSLREMDQDCMVLRTEQAPHTCREYQAVIQIHPLNFLLLVQEEQTRVLEGWRAFVASRTPEEGALCFHLRLRRQNLAPMLAQLDLTAQTHPLACYREKAHQHRAFLHQLADERTLLTRAFFVRVSLLLNRTARAFRRLTPQEAHAQARLELDRRVTAVMGGLSRVGLLSSRLEGKQLLQYYLSGLHRRFAERFGVPQAALEALGAPAPWRDLRDSWEPWRRRKHVDGMRGSLPELLAPASLEERSHYVRIHQETDEYVRGRAVIGYPASALPGWMDGLLSLDEPDIDVLCFLSTLDPRRTVQHLSRKLTSFHATQLLDERAGRTENAYIAEAQNEVADLRSKLVARTEQVHPFSLYVLTRAESEETLRARDAHVARWLSDLELQSVPLEYEHLPAWRSCLDGRDLLHRTRKVDTSTVVCSFPFCSSNLSTETGALVGLTPAQSLVVIDPTSRQLENGHELIFAQTGAGKSFYQKVSLMRLLMRGMEAIVIDPDGEFGRLCHAFGGASLTLSAEHLRLNPFDLLAGGQEPLALGEKIERLLLLCDLLLMGQDARMLPTQERSVLRRVLLELYAEHGITTDPQTHTRPVPQMRELYDRLCQQGDPYHLADRLLAHLEAFPTTTEVSLDNQLVVFNLQPIKDHRQDLLRVGVYLIIEHVWNVVHREQTHKPRLLLIDEAWVLMELVEGGQWLARLIREARKYNLHVRLVTQNADDFLSCKAGQDLLLNASMKMLLHHDQSALATLARAFHLSEEEQHFLTIADKGEGLFFCRSSHVPIKVIASDEERWLAETDPNQLRHEAEAFTAQAEAATPEEDREQGAEQTDPVESLAGNERIQAIETHAGQETPLIAETPQTAPAHAIQERRRQGARLLLPRVYDAPRSPGLAQEPERSEPCPNT